MERQDERRREHSISNDTSADVIFLAWNVYPQNYPIINMNAYSAHGIRCDKTQRMCCFFVGKEWKVVEWRSGHITKLGKQYTQICTKTVLILPAGTFAIVLFLFLGSFAWVGFSFVGVLQGFFLALSQLFRFDCFLTGLIFSWHIE